MEYKPISATITLTASAGSLTDLVGLGFTREQVANAKSMYVSSPNSIQFAVTAAATTGHILPANETHVFYGAMVQGMRLAGTNITITLGR